MPESGGSLLFVVKCLAVTIAIVFLMQIKIGHDTVEKHSLAWMQNSLIVDGLRGVATGAIYIGGKAYDFGRSLFEEAPDKTNTN